MMEEPYWVKESRRQQQAAMDRQLQSEREANRRAQEQRKAQADKAYWDRVRAKKEADRNASSSYSSAGDGSGHSSAIDDYIERHKDDPVDNSPPLTEEERREARRMSRRRKREDFLEKFRNFSAVAVFGGVACWLLSYGQEGWWIKLLVALAASFAVHHLLVRVTQKTLRRWKKLTRHELPAADMEVARLAHAANYAPRNEAWCLEALNKRSGKRLRESHLRILGKAIREDKAEPPNPQIAEARKRAIAVAAELEKLEKRQFGDFKKKG